MDAILTALEAMLERLAQLLPELIAASLTFLVVFGVGHLLAAGVRRMPARDARPHQHVRLISRFVRGGFGLIGLVLALQILGLTAVATSLLATGGLVAVILGFAFREIGENLLAGLFLSMSRSFEVGDLIESSGHTGKVREIDLRQVWIRSADGRDIFIPSAQIFRNVLVNYTRDGLRRAEFVVGIDYADPADVARELLLRETIKVDGVLSDPEATVRVSAFTPNYCELQVFFWIDTDTGPGLSEVRSKTMVACLTALRQAGYTLSSDVSTSVSVTKSAQA
jgi:small-conductance mechanosensitive channel